jgi:hypothetical protein
MTLLAGSCEKRARTGGYEPAPNATKDGTEFRIRLLPRLAALPSSPLTSAGMSIEFRISAACDAKLGEPRSIDWLPLGSNHTSLAYEFLTPSIPIQ